MAGEDAAACAPQVDGHAPRDAGSFDEETRALIAPDAGSLTAAPPSAANFAHLVAVPERKMGGARYYRLVGNKENYTDVDIAGPIFPSIE